MMQFERASLRDGALLPQTPVLKRAAAPHDACDVVFSPATDWTPGRYPGRPGRGLSPGRGRGGGRMPCRRGASLSLR